MMNKKIGQADIKEREIKSFNKRKANEYENLRMKLNEVNYNALKAKNEIKKLEEQFNLYKDNDVLRVAECEDLSDLVKKIGVRCLEGKESVLYKNRRLRIKVYRHIWKKVKSYFKVDKYKYIKRKDFKKAKEIIYNYVLDEELKEEIKLLKNQVK